MGFHHPLLKLLTENRSAILVAYNEYFIEYYSLKIICQFLSEI